LTILAYFLDGIAQKEYTNDKKLSMKLHPIQDKLLRIASQLNVETMSLRDIGRLIGESHPQKISHHLKKLEEKKLILVNRVTGVVKDISEHLERGESQIISVPVLGVANCGTPLSFADEHIEGYLKISKTLLKKSKDIFAVRASGSSMNRANIEGQNIEDGDFVIIDPQDKEPVKNRYILSIIDGLANIKKLYINQKNSQWILASESNEIHSDIYIHPNDSYMIGGRVIRVIKKPTK
jgi:SOS-response transcriptional repressor LexA